jgi:glycosyltransferase involved in cell wall biosynthesis
MAVYNGAEFIAQAIQSIIDQKHQNWKLEIINDGSNDSTYEIISTFLDPRIVCINMSKNEGLWNARNLGRTRALDDANWEYFTTIDADDFASPNWLSRNISLMSKSHAYAIRPINKRINVEGDFQYSYPACDQTFWSKRALNQLGLMETRQGANDSRYMKRAETMACLNRECILLSLSDNHSMRIHDNNHSMRAPDNNTSAD